MDLWIQLENEFKIFDWGNSYLWLDFRILRILFNGKYESDTLSHINKNLSLLRN